MAKFVLVIILNLLLVFNLHSQQVLDKIVAIVDDNIILQSELVQYSLNLAFQMKIDPQIEPDKFEQLQRQILENMVNQKILLVKAVEDTIEVNEREVDNVLDSQIERMIEQVGSVEKLEAYLGAPLKKIKRDFRDDVRDNLKVEALKTQKIRKIQISRREVEHFFKTMRDSLPELKETVDISHILLEIKPGIEAEQTARQRIEEIFDRLNKGEDFVELAKDYSEDPGSRSRGGELGFFQRGEFVREFEEVAFSLQPDEISRIVKTEHGFHIIQMIERRGEKINVRHILIRLFATSDDAQNVEQRINELAQILQATQPDFAKLASQHSDDATTKMQGGHLGQFAVDELQEKEFRRVVSTMTPGDISKPFKTRFGWHIIKLNERKEARELSIDKDWEQIERWALNLKHQQELARWIEELRKYTFIDIKY